jgi:pre-mRNA-splicing factor 18
LLKEEDLEKKMLPRPEVIRRLREMNQPIRLFGETDLEAFKRLNQIQTNELNEVGMRNDFKMAMDKSEQESLNEIMNPDEYVEASDKHDVEIKDEEIDFNEILELGRHARERNNDSMLVLKYSKVSTCLKFAKKDINYWIFN